MIKIFLLLLIITGNGEMNGLLFLVEEIFIMLRFGG